MRQLRQALILSVCSIFAPPSHALQEQTHSTQSFTYTYVIPAIRDYAPTPQGGLPWDYFARTLTEGDTDPLNPLAAGEQKPVFAPELSASEGKTVTMNGYMFPLGEGEGQERFLFGPFPVTCGYHYHVPPVLVVDVHAAQPLPMVYDAIVIQGRLQLKKNSDDPLYRLEDARFISAPARDARENWHPLFRRQEPDQNNE